MSDIVFLTWFCSLKHHINKICLVNSLYFWEFIKIQDGVQDGRQLQGFTMIDIFLQPLDRIYWFLTLYICFFWFWIQWEYIWKHQKSVSWWYFNYYIVWCHLSMKMTKDNINQVKQPGLTMAANFMDTQRWISFYSPLAILGDLWVILYVFLVPDSMEILYKT